MIENKDQLHFNEGWHSNEIIIDYDNVSYKDELRYFFSQLPAYTKNYLFSLFPIASWIHRYNLMWLFHDLIAGITVGIVVVPQSMGYAKIAELPPEYGLYTAFVGLCVYCLFATSKDISIGPTAVMSLLMGQTITRMVSSDLSMTGPEIAVVFSLLTGAITTFLGLVRLGILVDFIPAPAIAGFMSGSAITITIGQMPKLFGIPGINTQDSSYLIFGNFFRNLSHTKLDVAFGLISLFFLYGVRYTCQMLTKRYPKYIMHLFFISIMRNGIVVIFGTLIAFSINIGKSTSPISILKTVPPGFTAMGVPVVRTSVISGISSSLPSGVIILILEHVAIAKSFGRINDYKIDPNQEITAIGITNILASFFGAYPSTGSFSRTAILARSGVKTPIAGIFSALVVLLALYALTPAFYYIPDSVLAAVVIHAVAGLVSGPSYIKRLAAVSLWELLIFGVTVIITFFTTVEYGIYASVAMSIIILLFRIARPRFWSLGRIPLSTTVASIDYSCDKNIRNIQEHYQQTKVKNSQPNLTTSIIQNYLYVSEKHPSLGKFVEPLPAGILMCRVDESLTYPNSSFISEKIISYCKEQSRPSANRQTIKKGQRPWNDDATSEVIAARERLPLLHALIIDFSSVNRMDSSGLQAIIDVQNALNNYSGHHVEFHFVNILHPAIRRCLIVANFGTQPRPGDDTRAEVLPVVPASKDGPQLSANQRQHQDIETQMTPVDGGSSHDDSKDKNRFHIEHVENEQSVVEKQHDNLIEISAGPNPPYPSTATSITSLEGIPLPKDIYPFFHWSADEAVRSAMMTSENRQQALNGDSFT
ncbi:sulfate transporter family-domain-containing protein [Mycotypha africana]|uniref:sulfate transporter family-domain-containing protein n=1 Tax=Mycotypha africana TaxID=64632 RepID=UPI002301C1C7|nr:sulfate transporter family-domain-containing protein [Mycotypha africana]KAI8979259.1 sulfate transporter family-domain-containing protein [Mycotypha africana]